MVYNFAMRKLILLLLLCAPLFAQGGDYCNKLIIGPNEQCFDQDPFVTNRLTYCEWYLYNGVITPIQNDTAYMEASVMLKSGYHPHDTGAGRPKGTFPRAGGTLYIDTTGNAGAGCISAYFANSGYAGIYTISGYSNMSRQQGKPDKKIDYALHYLSGPINFPASLAFNSQTMILQVDQSHGGNNDFLRNDRQRQVGHLAMFFYMLTGQPLNIFRLGLPDGGKSDNDLGEFLQQPPGNWTNSLRSWEWHENMDEVDVYNPTMWLSDTTGVLDDKLNNALESSGCVSGDKVPGSSLMNPVYASYNFWRSQPQMHLQCVPQLLGFNPPGITQ